MKRPAVMTTLRRVRRRRSHPIERRSGTLRDVITRSGEDTKLIEVIRHQIT